MGIKRLSIFIVIFLTFSCSQKINRNIKKPNFKHFKISFEQDGQIKNIEDHSVELNKSPFSIIITFTGPDNIFINASLESESFISSNRIENITNIIKSDDIDVNEELFNRDELLILSNKALNFWHYANNKEHRFSETTEKPGTLICKRKISNILNIDDNEEKINISELQENTIYMVAMKLEWNKDFSKSIEKKREYIKIIFGDHGIM